MCGVTLFAFGLTGCFLLPKEEALLPPPVLKQPQIKYDTYTVEKGTIEDSVSAGGRFIYAEQHALSFKSTTGRLKSIDVTYLQKVKKGDVVAQLDTANLGLQIQEQQLQVKKAQITLERQKTLGADKFQLQIGAIDVQLAQLQLQQLENQMESSVIRSPMDGTITYIASVEEGSFIDSYTIIAEVADPSKLYVAYDGSNIGDFRLGMSVTVTVNDKGYEGTVVMTPAQFPIDAPESEKNQIYVSMSKLPPGVEAGDSASLHLILERKQNVLIIPRAQVQLYLGRKFVYVLSNGVRTERDVETGIENATQVEIVKGLKEGEKIVLR